MKILFWDNSGKKTDNNFDDDAILSNDEIATAQYDDDEVSLYERTQINNHTGKKFYLLGTGLLVLVLSIMLMFATINYFSTQQKIVEDVITPMKLVCYYTTFRTDVIPPENIDPFLCTHIIAAFINVDNGTLTVANITVFERVVALKQKNPALKVLVCLGSGTQKDQLAGSVTTESDRKSIVNQFFTFVQEYGFDGLDIDWEFPSWGQPPEQREQFVALLKDFRETFDSVNPPLLLTVAVAAPQMIIDISYDPPEMAKYIDFISVMSYDFHFYTWYLPVTGANAPLHPLPTEVGITKILNTAYSANYWLKKGMPKDKILVGIPTYGHSYTLVNSTYHDYYSPAAGIGKLGNGGDTSYLQVCDFINIQGATRVFNPYALVPHAYLDDQWVSYADEESVLYKAQWIKANGYPGAMIFDIYNDDFHQDCANSTRAFPLINAVKDYFVS